MARDLSVIRFPAFRYILYLSGFKNLTGIKMPLLSGLEEKFWRTFSQIYLSKNLTNERNELTEESIIFTT